MNVRTHFRNLLSRLGNNASFSDADDVFEKGVLKSVNVIELIDELETTYSVTVDPADVFEGRLRSVDQLVAFVAERGVS